MANICSATLTPIDLSCDGAAGGIKRVLVAPRTSIVKPTPDENGVIKATDLKATTSGVAFVEYMFRPETGSMTSTGSIDTAIGSTSVVTDLALQFTKMEATKRVAIQQAINTGSVCIVQDFGDKCYYLGFDMAVYASEATAVTGQAIGDLNGYTLNLQDRSFALPYLVEATDTELDALKVSVPEL